MTFFARILCSVLVAVAALPCVAHGSTQLAGNESGAGALLEQVLTQRTRPLYASIRSPGGAFGRLRPISPAYYNFYNQQVAVDDTGGAVAVWSQFDQWAPAGPPPRVFAAVRRPGGRFGPQQLVARDVDYDAPLLAANRRGDAIVVWARFNHPSQYSFRPAGGSFSKAITIPAADGADAIALDDDGGAFFVWSSSKEGGKAAYRPPGGSFGAPQPVAGPPPGQVLSRAGIATDRDGEMLLVWREGDTLRGIERQPRGESFGAPFVVAAGLGKDDGLLALTVAPSRRAAVAYGTSPLKVAVRDADAWSTPQELTVGRLTSGFRLAMNGRGDAALSWASDDRAVHASYRSAGSAFGPPRRLALPRPSPSFPGESFVRPGLALDASGRATVTWEESNGAHVSVYARDFFAGHARKRVRIGRLRSFRREGPASACRPSWARVVKSTRRATVLVVKRGDDAGDHYACLLARGALVAIDSVEEALFPPIALAGPLVGYAGDSCDPDECDTFIFVTDLRDEFDGVNRIASAGPGRTSEVPALVLKPNGAAAWVSCPSYNPAYGLIDVCKARSRTRKWVYALDRRRLKPRLLDVGRRIDPGSLSLHGSRLTWRRGGMVHAARLH